MTKQTFDHPTRRETATEYRGRPLLIELHPGFLVIRQKGKQESFSMDYPTLYESAAKLKWLQERASAPARKGKR